MIQLRDSHLPGISVLETELTHLFHDFHFLFSFFPDILSPYISVLSNTVFALLVKMKICSSSHRKFELKVPAVNLTLSGTDVHDAERRR